MSSAQRQRVNLRPWGAAGHRDIKRAPSIGTARRTHYEAYSLSAVPGAKREELFLCNRSSPRKRKFIVKSMCGRPRIETRKAGRSGGRKADGKHTRLMPLMPAGARGIRAICINVSWRDSKCHRVLGYLSYSAFLYCTSDRISYIGCFSLNRPTFRYATNTTARPPDVINASRSEKHPGDKHQRSVEGLKVVIVVALSLRTSRGKVNARRAPVAVRVLSYPSSLAVGVDHQRFCLAFNVLRR